NLHGRVRNGPATLLRQAQAVDEEEVGVLEGSEKAEIRDQAEQEPGTPAPRCRRRLDEYSRGIIDHAGEEDDPDKPGVPRHVEEPAGHQQEAVLVAACAQQVIAREHEGQEEEEILTGEVHPGSLASS